MARGRVDERLAVARETVTVFEGRSGEDYDDDDDGGGERSVRGAAVTTRLSEPRA